MATSYTSNKKIGALDSASTPLAATNEIVINQNGDILKTPLSAVEAKVFDAKSPATTSPTGTEVVVIRKTDNSLSQVALADIVPALNITNAKVSASAAIEDTKLATINTAGKVTNQAVQAVSTNTANRIVTRDGSGNFAAGTITATLSGNASSATTVVDGAITNVKVAANAAIALSKLATGALPSGITVASANLVNGTIVDADVASNAAIAGTKISPDFGSQNITTSGNANINRPSDHWAATGVYVVGGAGRLGQLDTHGGFEVTLTSNGYRDNTAGTNLWKSYGANSETGAAQIGLNPDGSIHFRTEGSKATGAANAVTERMRVDSFGRVLIGASTNIGFQPLQVHSVSPADVVGVYRWAGDSAGPRINLVKSRGTSVGTNTVVQDGDSLGLIRFQGADGSDTASIGASIEVAVDGTPGTNDVPGLMIFSTTADGDSSPTERMRIDKWGRVIINSNASLSLGSFPEKLQVHSTFNTAVTSCFRWANDISGPRITLVKSRGASVGTNTIVQNGDELGEISFQGADGTDTGSSGASIEAFVDGTPGSNDMPGRLVFSTTADGASTPTERMRIRADGKVGIGTSSPSYLLDVNGIVNTNATYRVNGQNVVGPRRTGWTAPTGTFNRGTFDSGTVTLPQLAARVHALIDDLAAHGLIDS